MTQSEKPLRILFVCLGNICRSPMAEGVFRHLLHAKGMSDRVLLDSAGTGSWHVGEPPDPRARRAAAKRGVEISHLVARQVSPKDFADFDLILAMDRSNLADLQAMAPPEHRHKIKLFLSYADDAPTQEVPDPYYGGPEGFDRVLDLLEAASEGLLHALSRHPNKLSGEPPSPS